MNSLTKRFLKRSRPAIQQVKPEPSLKGKFKGNCNMTRCQKPGATWFNHSTRKFYCPECAAELNLVNKKDAMEIFGHNLCTLEIPDE